MLNIWTRRKRGDFQRLIEQVRLEQSEVVNTTKQLALSWAKVIPAQWKDIDIGPLVMHKIAGYNVELHALVINVLAASRATDKYLDVYQPPWMIYPLRGFSLDEYVLRERVTRAEGHFWHMFGEQRANVSLKSAARCDVPGYIPLEVPLPDIPNNPPLLSGIQTPILFMASMNNYLNPMIPVMERLVELGHDVIILLPRFSRKWKNYIRLPDKLDKVFIEDLLTVDILEIYQQMKSEYQQFWKDHQGDLCDIFMLEGVSLWPLIQRDMENVLVNYVPHCIAYIEMAQLLVDDLGVRVAVCARLRRAVENSFFALFRNRDIFSMMLIHGHISDQPFRYFDDGYFEPVDAICVWGEDQLNKLLSSRSEVKLNQIRLTGNPAWDSLVSEQLRTQNRNELRRKIAGILGSDANQFWVTLIAEGDIARQFDAIQRVVLRVPDVLLLVKVRPGETPDWYSKNRNAEVGKQVQVIPHGEVELHDLLAASDVVLTFSSTTNLEALLLGTPVITVALNPELVIRDRLVYLENFGLPFVTKEDDLYHHLEYLKGGNPTYKEKLSEASRSALDELVINSRDGSATDRVASIIANLLKNSAQ